MFQKNCGIENVCGKEGDGGEKEYDNFLQIFLSDSAKNYRTGTL